MPLQANDEDDVQGHAPVSHNSGAPVSAPASAIDEDDDVEGHAPVSRSGDAPVSAPASLNPASADEDDDVQGHSMR